MMFSITDRLNRLVEYMEGRNFIVSATDILPNGDWLLVAFYPANWKEGDAEYNGYIRDQEAIYQQRLYTQIDTQAIARMKNDDAFFTNVVRNLKEAYDELKFIPPPSNDDHYWEGPDY